MGFFTCRVNTGVNTCAMWDLSSSRVAELINTSWGQCTILPGQIPWSLYFSCRSAGDAFFLSLALGCQAGKRWQKHTTQSCCELGLAANAVAISQMWRTSKFAAVPSHVCCVCVVNLGNLPRPIEMPGLWFSVLRIDLNDMWGFFDLEPPSSSRSMDSSDPLLQKLKGKLNRQRLLFHPDKNGHPEAAETRRVP